MSKQKTILILFVKAGGGHESAAKSIKVKLEKFGHKVILVDMLASSPKWAQKQFDTGYVILTENLPWLWISINKMWNFRWFNLCTYWIFKLLCQNHIKQAILKNCPDMVLSTYFFGQKLSQNILISNQLKFPNYTIVSEIFQVPKIWFTFPGKYIIFSEQAFTIAKAVTQNYKIKSTIIKFGYFFNSLFNTIIQPKVNNNNQPFSILILGGGSSLPKGSQLLSKILELKEKTIINLVCGRNQNLYKQCLKIKNTPSASNHILNIWAFTDTIPDLISNCDVIVTKGGPAVIFESLSQIKPVIIYDYIKPQEKGNVDFVLNNGFGIFEPDFDRLLVLLTRIITNPNILEGYKIKIKQANIKSDEQALINFLENQFTSN